MPATDFQGASVPFASIGRSLLSIRRDQVHSMEGPSEAELELFQKQVADRFRDLSAAGSGSGSGSGEDLLSLTWIHHLLDEFICCQEEFRAILFNNKAGLSRPPMDRLIGEYFERSVKALDVCNAVRDGVELIRQWHKYLEIVLTALDSNQRTIGEGQFRRAKKALTDLTIAMIDEKDSSSSSSSSALAHRNRSFGRNNTSKDHRPHGHFRSLSWSVSRSWSAAKQLQAIANNLTPPKGNEGLAVAMFTMSSILLFVMWTLVAAIPCQDRGLQMHFSIPRHFSWGTPLMLLHDKIMEESKKRERRNACGLMKEIHQMEKSARQMTELADSLQFPLTEERETEVKEGVKELAEICEAMKDGLDPLERQVREVFHRILRNRTEGLDCLNKPTHPE